MLNVDNKGLHIENLNHFNKEHSPTIPKAFPKELLPKDMCQHSLSRMLQCLMGSQANKCGEVNKLYYMCKRERDAQLFTSIKDWEVGHVKAMGPADAEHGSKADYIASLEQQRLEFINTFESLPQSIANKHRRWRIAADIEQLKWRIDNLNEMNK